jgi:hypothetical protein
MRGSKNKAKPARLLPAFAELRSTLDSGDLVLFGGDSPVCRRLKRLMRSRWSHVGLVARAAGIDRPLLWEATADTDLKDVVTGQVKAGVQMVDLEEWITHYAGETAIRKLRVERTAEMRAALASFLQEVHGRPYERNGLELLRATYEGPLGKNRREDLSSLFCSELVAAAYQRMGLLPAEPPSNEYTPRDFSRNRQPALALLRGATLGEEILVCG